MSTGLFSRLCSLEQPERPAVQVQVLAQVQVLEERINELKDAIAHSDDPEYIMNYAQKEGGMVEPDSIRFVDTSK